jgi:hypothetical protein
MLNCLPSLSKKKNLAIMLFKESNQAFVFVTMAWSLRLRMEKERAFTQLHRSNLSNPAAVGLDWSQSREIF